MKRLSENILRLTTQSIVSANCRSWTSRPLRAPCRPALQTEVAACFGFHNRLIGERQNLPRRLQDRSSASSPDRPEDRLQCFVLMVISSTFSAAAAPVRQLRIDAVLESRSPASRNQPYPVE